MNVSFESEAKYNKEQTVHFYKLKPKLFCFKASVQLALLSAAALDDIPKKDPILNNPNKSMIETTL